MLNIIEMYSTLQASMTALKTLASGDWPFICVVLGFSLLAFVEFQRPKIPLRPKQHINAYRVNLGLFALNSLLMSALSIAGLLLALEHFSGRGLLNGMRSPVWRALMSFLLLDFLLYAWHRICHQFDGLWMFHKVHHSDPYLNVSTAFRIHIAELIITTVLKSAYIILLGIDKTVVFAYETVYPLFVMFHHTNIAFVGEKWLGQVIVTPCLHRTHHSIERKEHDSNYGAIFSIWDRLFLSRKEVEPTAVGIKIAAPQSVWGLVKFGFVNTAPPMPAPAYARRVSVNIHAMIAEAAYYKAEKRAFSPGYELYDWLEAKKEILRQVNGKERSTQGDRCMNC
ncbi:sterol desaturase family protein [Methylomicrobium sp. Wu6]|uniref:sterol desaturase family protein n=1 Tax=Methylomicrobium sp. Wu6 TaxID=3107928 RepID=UPI002DD6687D|nr:sterol desaturase family protein [Methylomicrobium sp. Wu6]MEC4748270.1 sterol desaturase family protein [Methylomicrobium sp. Wu6]